MRRPGGDRARRSRPTRRPRAASRPPTPSRRPAPRSPPARPGSPASTPSFSFRFKQLWDAPPNGLYGVESGKGFVGPWEEGFLYGSAAIFLFVLAVGAFITVTMKTEAIQTGIGRLALRFRSSGAVLIAILMCVFALGGTSYGMWEETLGFFVLLVPLALALGYDRMVGGRDHLPRRRQRRDRLDRQPVLDRRRLGRRRASASATGIGLRIAMWFVLVSLAIALRDLVRAADPGASREVGRRRLADRRRRGAEQLITDVPALTGRQKLILVALRRRRSW